MTARAVTAGFPAVGKKPGARGIRPVAPDGAQRSAGDELERFSQHGGVRFAGRRGGMQAELPENFVGHPVADAREAGLVEQQSLERTAGVAAENVGDMCGGECSVQYFRRQCAPPRGRLRAALHTPVAKLPRVAIHERTVGGDENKVIMLLRRVVWRLAEHFAGHAEMSGQPNASAEGEEHVLSVGERLEVIGTGECFGQGTRVAAAEDAGLRVDMDSEDAFAQPGVPAPGVVGDFG